jgi:Cu/Ag efflux protein CusF
VLKHGDIPNLGMPAMTMGFQVADRKMLAGYKPGDQVRFQAEMIKDTATVTELERR